MHSFLVSSRNKQAGFDQIDKILNTERISEFDKNRFSFEKPAGIEDIREIQSKLHLKPFRGKKRAIILDFSSGATTQAQNSMLKILEEPPPSTIILIYAKSREDFLPTILSRCKVIEIKNIDKQTDTDFSEEINKILEAGVGEKLVIAQDWGVDRDSALQNVEQTIFAVEAQLLKSNKDDLPNYLKLLRALNSAYSDLKFSNVSPRFILENYLLSI